MDISPSAFVVQPSSGVPIYRQLIDQVRGMIAAGRVQPGDVLPSVRQLGAELEVNFMTISKAWAKLEAEGVVEHDRGRGMVVTGARRVSLHAENQQQVRVLADQAVIRGLQCGMSRSELLGIFKASIEEHLQ
ncbi:MAG: HTH-type transcriptional repressor YtrA [Planctomycetota bacterium]|jgi:GntR family transcriptional regulator